MHKDSIAEMSHDTCFDGAKTERELGLTYAPIRVAIEEEVKATKKRLEPHAYESPKCLPGFDFAVVTSVGCAQQRLTLGGSMYCPGCGDQVGDGDKFCGNCGTRLLDSADPDDNVAGGNLETPLLCFGPFGVTVCDGPYSMYKWQRKNVTVIELTNTGIHGIPNKKFGLFKLPALRLPLRDACNSRFPTPPSLPCRCTFIPRSSV